eukprot:CAMPEP_0174358488 /NCGR_PEP_ID=MMETSP0811_2-20130205/42986_1 /TAXON_ID=73025 ORGANISM="Eutreptiella gymnastica-like, Strain CCMP1594" /NCGR_SAMPLE_ID=MMETSP0811_2 /ASSEMBLY_ACC=CAM_ASM_000667 /LENGTH=82 /DNA_ID=CAMNT_0015492319 /DNA_START=59 /DNA_END=307 /DNA_ORIENTATION=-
MARRVGQQLPWTIDCNDAISTVKQAFQHDKTCSGSCRKLHKWLLGIEGDVSFVDDSTRGCIHTETAEEITFEGSVLGIKETP